MPTRLCTATNRSGLQGLLVNGRTPHRPSCWCRSTYGFKLLASATGGPVKRKGGSHPPAAPGTTRAVGAPKPKEQVRVPYKIGAQDFEQVWEVETEPISTDWRDEVREASGRVLDFYCIPRVKLYMHTCLYLAYVALLIWCFTLSTDLTTGELPVATRLVSKALYPE